MIKTEIFIKEGIDNRQDMIKASKIYYDIVKYMKGPKIQDQISTTHKLNTKSSEIQELILDKYPSDNLI